MELELETRAQWFAQWMDDHREEFRTLSRRIWSFAETGLEEVRSAEALCQTLNRYGFQVEQGVGGLPTAFVGRFGTGKPVIGLLGEFDALEGLSQQAGVAVRQCQPGQVNGHGCGHNLLGCGSLAAAIALKEYMVRHSLSGSVCYYGCPGEENGCGKMHMAEAGCFRELDAALAWHPQDCSSVDGRSSLADLCMEFRFTGVSAHAASCPHLGRSALDALELLNIACNFMREHIPPEARIHYAITDTGGNSPNIVPPHAAALYEVRAPKLTQAVELRDRLVRAAQGAALMTDTEMAVSFGDSYSDYLPNHRLNQTAFACMQAVGAPVFTEEEKSLAARLRSTFGETSGPALREDLLPYDGLGGCLPASTDLGNVSQLVPTVQLYTACCANGTPGHSWQMVSQTGCSIGERGMAAAAKTLALTGLRLLEEPAILEEAWAEFRRETAAGSKP